MAEFAVLMLGVFVLLIGLIFVIVALVNNSKVAAARNWPAAPGTILRTEVKEYINRSSGITSRSYEPIIHYQYNVMGSVMEGKRLGFGTTRLKDDAAQKVTERYIPGSHVNVFYNPNKPQESVLEVAASSSKAFLIIGAIMAGLGLLLLVIQII